MSITPSARTAPPAQNQSALRERVDEAPQPSVRDDFERSLEAAATRVRSRSPRDREEAAGVPQHGAGAAHRMVAPDARAEGVAGASPALSILEFAAALDRLQVPVAVPGVPSQWEFTLDASHAPLQAVRVTESATGGWDVALHAALPAERPLLAARLDRLRARLAGRGVPVAHLRVDESDG